MATVKLSNPDKILFPGSRITKKQLVAYYEMAAPYMLKHLAGRPLSLQRYPEGIHTEGFFQKEVPEYYPEYIDRILVKEEKKGKYYAAVHNKEGLMYLANMAAITIHTWESREGNLRKPDQLIWDLDPSQDNFEHVRIGARLLRFMLQELGLEPWIKLTGSRGVHVCVPVIPEHTYTVAKKFTRDVADFIAARLPELFTTELVKKKRGTQIFVDYLRNEYGHTAAAAYTVRLLENAPIAAPITWEELDDESFVPQRFNIRNMKQRFEEVGDVWEHFYDEPQDIKPAMEKLKGIKEKHRAKS